VIGLYYVIAEGGAEADFFCLPRQIIFGDGVDPGEVSSGQALIERYSLELIVVPVIRADELGCTLSDVGSPQLSRIKCHDDVSDYLIPVRQAAWHGGARCCEKLSMYLALAFGVISPPSFDGSFLYVFLDSAFLSPRLSRDSLCATILVFHYLSAAFPATELPDICGGISPSTPGLLQSSLAICLPVPSSISPGTLKFFRPHVSDALRHRCAPVRVN
jgi:hypothetical protein